MMYRKQSSKSLISFWSSLSYRVTNDVAVVPATEPHLQTFTKHLLQVCDPSDSLLVLVTSSQSLVKPQLNNAQLKKYVNIKIAQEQTDTNSSNYCKTTDSQNNEETKAGNKGLD